MPDRVAPDGSSATREGSDEPQVPHRFSGGGHESDSAGIPPVPPPDDLLDPGEPFDASQWAVHGLLSVFYDAERGDQERRIQSILDRAWAVTAVPVREPILGGAAAPAGPSRERERAVPGGAAVPARPRSRIIRLWLTRRRVLGGSLAAAVLIAVGLYIATTSAPRPAFAADLLRAPTPPAGLGANCGGPTCAAELLRALVSGDAAALSERAAVIDAARADLETRKAAVVESCTSDGGVPANPEAPTRLITLVLHAWTRVFRPLRDLGRFDEALAEIDAALAYARGDNPAGVLVAAWVGVLLNDLGDVYALSADYGAARTAYHESIAAREQDIDAGVAASAQRWQAAWRAAFPAGTMPELYWRLSYLAALEGDLRSARQEHARAEACLRDYFVGVCRVTDTPLPEGAGLLDAFDAVPLAFRLTQETGSLEAQAAFGGLTHEQVLDRYQGYEPNPLLTNYVRTHLFCEARLLRMEGDFAGAQRALRAAARIVYHPVHDYLRLDFYEPLEAARVALALREYDLALEELSVAEHNTGPIDYFCDDLNRPPIGPLPQAELKLLRGLALRGLNTRSAEARALLGQALKVPRQMAQSLPAEQRAPFLRQFQTWDELAKAAR